MTNETKATETVAEKALKESNEVKKASVPTATPKTPPPAPKEEEMVTIKKGELQELMDRLKRVEFAADKAHLARFDSQNQGEKQTEVRVRTFEGKIIMGWSDMTSNIVEKNANGAWFENQSTLLTFEDGSEQEINYALFARRYKHITGIIQSETKEGSQVIYKLSLEDGREISINSKFVN